MNKVSSTSELAELISEQVPVPQVRIRRAYTWVTQNIKYSADGIFAINHGVNADAKIDVAFKNRKGVCENFAAIFSDLCDKMGFPAVVIEGYAIQNNVTDRVGHSWSAVFIDDDWFLFDPTWDVGKGSNFNYFKKSGEEFSFSHIPYDPMWQMMNYPIKKGGKRSKSYFNYKDSIQIFLASGNLQRFESSFQRIQNAESKNSLADTHKKVLQNNIEIERQEEQMTWYNTAVAYINQVSQALNAFIDLRNNQFATVTNDDNLKKKLSGIMEDIDSSLVYLHLVDKSKAVLIYGTQPARDQIEKLKIKYSEQRIFLNRYITLDMHERRNLFFQH